MRHWVEYGCAYGTVFIKPNGESLDVFTPADVMIVDYDNQEIKGLYLRILILLDGNTIQGSNITGLLRQQWTE